MSGVPRRATPPLEPRNFWERLFWALLVCRECDGKGELYYPQWPKLPQVWRFPGGLAPADEGVEVKLELCRLCEGTGRLLKASSEETTLQTKENPIPRSFR
jgi:hypothetical protein